MSFHGSPERDVASTATATPHNGTKTDPIVVRAVSADQMQATLN